MALSTLVGGTLEIALDWSDASTQVLWIALLDPWLESVTGFFETADTERWPLIPFILVGSYLLARAVTWWSRRRLAEPAAEGSSFSRAVFEEIHTPVAITIGLLGIYLSLDVLSVPDSASVLPGVIATIAVVIWARTAIRIGNRWIGYLNDVGASYEFAPMFKNLWTIGVVVGSLLLLLSIWELEITPFLASAGILGIVLGFAAQDAISNLIGGVALYFDNTYKIGDVIQVEGEMRGTVTDVGIRSTTVLTTDNVLVTVPNSVLNSTQVVNETAPQRHVRIRVPLSAAYGTDYHEVEELVLEACEDAPLIRRSPAPRVLFDEFGDSALIFELRAYISHPLTEKRAVDQINRYVYDAFDEAGITIPFPQRELSFLEDGAEHRFDERASLAPQRPDGATNPDAEPVDHRRPHRADTTDAADQSVTDSTQSEPTDADRRE
ncbi:mechanosensitive ion channel family protein [Natrialbaceae archaeon A-CW3]